MPTHTPHVIVLSHRIDGDSASKSYAVYRIRTVESDFACEVERRWSHVRTLYNELWSKWKAQLQRSDWSPPSFSHHTVGRRTDEVLLARREKQLERLLQFFIRALGASLGRAEGPEVLRVFLSASTSAWESQIAPAIAAGGTQLPATIEQARSAARGVAATTRDGKRMVDPPYRGRTELRPAELQAACDAPTPASRFYTPSEGWPASVAADSSRGRELCCPQLVVPHSTTHRSHPPHPPGGNGAAAAASAPVGELCVEVLEASGLPNLDNLSLTDAFALILYEHTAARTSTIDDDLEPKWHAECPRAFRLPIHHASSSLFIALFDDDSSSTLGELDDDDPIGRVVIQPCSLRPRTAIDAWWPLTHHFNERPGSRGSIRLRITVTWHAERTLLWQPIELLQQAATAPLSIKLTNRRAMVSVEYAYRGLSPETRYSWPVLRANLADAARFAIDCSQFWRPLQALVFWEDKFSSMIWFLSWQLLTIYPQYIPATFPFILLLILNRTYQQASAQPHLLRPLPFWRLCGTLVHRRVGIPPLDGDHRDEDDDKNTSRRNKPRRLASTKPFLVQKAEDYVSLVVKPAWNVATLPARRIAATVLQDGSDASIVQERHDDRTPSSPPAAAPTLIAAFEHDGSNSVRNGINTAMNTAMNTANGGRSPAAAAASSSSSPHDDHDEHLSDDAAIETVLFVYNTVRSINRQIWKGFINVIGFRPRVPMRLRRGRTSLELVKSVASQIDPNAINPVAWVLGPVQNMIGDLLVHARAAQRLASWQDGAATCVLYLALASLTLFLAMVPWAIVIPFVITWTARLLGVLALGPQNIWLQPYLQRSADRAIEEQQAIKRAQERAKLALATPGGTSRGRDKSRESADLEEDDDAWVFEMESARSVPRQPCLPDVKSAFHFRPA